MYEIATYQEVKAMSKEQRAEMLQKLQYEIDVYTKRSLLDNIKCGYRWKFIHDFKLWRALDGIKSFQHYIAKETTHSRASAYNFMDLAEKFGAFLLENPDMVVPQNRLLDCKAFVKTGEDAEEWIHKASTSNKDDWDITIRKVQNKKTSDSCSHNNTSSYIKCEDCGKWLEKIEGD